MRCRKDQVDGGARTKVPSVIEAVMAGQRRRSDPRSWLWAPAVRARALVKIKMPISDTTQAAYRKPHMHPIFAQDFVMDEQRTWRTARVHAKAAPRFSSSFRRTDR